MLSVEINGKLTKQSKREVAYSDQVAQQYFQGAHSFDRIEHALGHSSTRSVAYSLYRYPSPDRPAYSPSRPITVFRLCSAESACDIGYHDEIVIHRQAGCTHSGATHETTIGLRLCKRHQSSLRQWQYLVWQVASITTLSAVSLARQVVLWLPKCLAQTAQEQCSLVPPLACCATTPASAPAAKVNHRACLGRAIKRNRRRGVPPVAVFSFLGITPRTRADCATASARCRGTIGGLPDPTGVPTVRQRVGNLYKPKL